MNRIINANQLQGRAIGALFFSGFGALWLVLALYVREELHAAAVGGVLLVLAVLALAALYLLRAARRWPRVPDDPAMGRAFKRVNTIQWVAIFVVAFVLARLHLDVYIPTAVAVIVGLHMFPLARLFNYPQHYATGALLVAWAAGSAVFAPASTLQGTAALGTGVILWLSAILTLTLAFLKMRQPSLRG
jgi:hypothetical protein